MEKVKLILAVFMIMALFLVAGCGSSDSSPSTDSGADITGNAVAEPGYSCVDIAALKGKVTKKQARVDAEAKELLTKTTSQAQRVQKFKVMKLNRELKTFQQDLAALEAKC